MIHLEAKILRNALAILQKATPRRARGDLLSNCLFIRHPDSCTLETTDNEISAQITLPQPNSDSESKFLLPINKLLPMARSSDDDFTFSTTDNGCIDVRSGNSQFYYNAQSANSFPQLSDSQSKELSFEIPSDLFLSAIRRCQFPDDEGKHLLGGVYLSLEEGTLRVAGNTSNGSCMAVQEITLENSTSHSREAVIPNRALTILLSLNQNSQEPIQVYLSPNMAFFIFKEWKISSPLLQSKPPRYQRLLDIEISDTLDILVKDLKPLFARASILCNEDLQMVEFSHHEGKLTVQGRNPTQGQSEVWMATEFDTPEFSFYVDPRKVLDFCSRFPSETIFQFGLAHPEDGPLVFDVDENYRFAMATMDT